MSDETKTKILQSVSNCMHPLLMLTYAAVALVLFTPLAILPLGLKFNIVGMVFVCTCMIPVLVISILFKLGVVGHWALRDRADRGVPLGINVFAYVLCAYILTKMQFPNWALTFYYGAVGLAFVCWIVSYWWKISAHATGIAGLTTAAMLLYLRFPFMMPECLPFICIVATGLLCSIRVYLGRHTMAQITAGTAVGIVTMLVTNAFMN